MLARESRLVGKGSPFELVETALNGLPYRTYRHGPKTLNDLYQRAARAPDREFLTHSERRLTRTAILQQGSALGRLLRESFRISRGMRVGLLLGNEPEWLIGFVAITSIGATAVAWPAHADPSETITALELTGCSLVIAGRTVSSQLAEAGYRGSMIDINENSERDASSVSPFALNVSSCTSLTTFDTPAIDPGELALIAFTSGSTGHSKGVMINHRSLLHGMMNMLLGAALSGGGSELSDRPSGPGTAPISLLAAPFSHISGYSHLLLMLFLGGKIVVPSEWDPGTALALIKREAVTSISGATPAMLRELISNSRAAHMLGSLRWIGIHGVSLVPSLLSEIVLRLPHVTVSTGYGMTETNGTICAISGAQLTQRPTSSGRPLPTVDIRIEQSEDMKNDGPPGEILVRGAMLMQGYCGQSVYDSSAIASEWFPTGDLGFMDADGFVHVTDRAAHIIVCDGHRISCGAIERSLLNSDLVKDVVVIDGQDLHHGNRLVVIAVPHEGKTCQEKPILERTAALTHADLLEPHLIWVKTLPHTPTGKIDGRQLKQHLIAHRTCSRQRNN
jgi:acyl-CoA synthetase (AMP-forming)/AMP-acid ligase II